MEFKLLKIKICGVKLNIEKISNLFPDFIGFIFYPYSPRFVGKNFFPPKLKKGILKTGVFVNESKENILKIGKKLDFVQLHGTESPSYCEDLTQKNGLKLIKSFRIDDSFSFKKIKNYIYSCSYFLFDSQTPFYGGSGKKFTWNKLYEYHFDTPFFLSGGIGIEDIENIKNFSHPKMFGIDINSRFEISPGNKDKTSINNFIKEIRKR
ncbi:phosphoribosylanthranilate isomerase [Blattabacterium cuenoti]|uniref:phosphoribosylanthranilate isomerase n=1 Tax=Blattabacterium cuenoti TaxID=1653831 RepID=UPI00163CF807|nr:phosphoribosylanthranilate isomerase [Blattabacterium cuenoti]